MILLVFLVAVHYGTIHVNLFYRTLYSDRSHGNHQKKATYLSGIIEETEEFNS